MENLNVLSKLLSASDCTTFSKQLISLTCGAYKVWQLVAGCLVSLYLKGDILPLFSRISPLQEFLRGKEAFSQSLPKQPRAVAVKQVSR